MRGQMFIVTAVFLVGLIFVVQQILFQYESVDPRTGFQYNEFGAVASLRDAVNATLANSTDCDNLAANMDVLKSFIDYRSASAGFTEELKYSIDCASFWNNPPSLPPLNATIRFLGSNIDSTSNFIFYKGS